MRPDGLPNALAFCQHVMPKRPDGLTMACMSPIDDQDLCDLSQIRFRKALCRTHFKEALSKARIARNTRGFP